MVVKIMIGLPASGKSTYVKDYKQEDDLVLSSDEIRLELFWDESSQENNWLVFETLFTRLTKAIKENKYNVWIDATNITKKDRLKIFNVINWRAFINGIVFEVPISELIKRDEQRNRTVWKDVILKMLSRYQKPLLEEWFDNLDIITTEIKISINLWHCLEYIKDNEFIQNMNWVEQKSFYHQEDLVTHLNMIVDQIKEDNPNYTLLILLTLFHDIWKPIVRKTKRENLLMRWYTESAIPEFYVNWDKTNPKKLFSNKKWEPKEVSRPDDYQFIWHELLSANIFRFEFKDTLIKLWLISKMESYYIELIIRYHLEFHKCENEIEMDWVIYKEWDFLFDLGKQFSDYDQNGRITLDNN